MLTLQITLENGTNFKAPLYDDDAKEAQCRLSGKMRNDRFINFTNGKDERIVKVDSIVEIIIFSERSKEGSYE